MYEELVKQCRGCLDSLCGECKYEHLQKAGNFVPCMNALLGEATNAIEELSRDLDSMNDANIALYGALPKWIPVTERFPNFGVKALCKCRANIYEVLKWTAEGWEHDPQHIYMSGFVTHWMPLPSAPTEET